MVKVSVILPVYNGEKYLAQSIESVLKQTYKDLELIIVNDCSIDNTLNISNEYAQKDGRVKVITNTENKKLPASLNIGFSQAQGEYLTWTSDDNFYKLNAIDRMLQFLNEHPENTMVCSDFYRIDTKNQNNNCVMKLEPSKLNMMFGNQVGACFLYRKSVADEVGEYDDSMFLAEDYDYWLRILLKGDIGHIDECLYNYRIHSKSLTGTRMSDIDSKKNEIITKYKSLYFEKFENLQVQYEDKTKQEKEKTKRNCLFKKL